MLPEEHIPRFYHWLFSVLCKEELYHELAGDLEESFAENYQQLGPKKAKSIYRKEVLKMLRPSVIRKFQLLPTFSPFDMLKNYFKIAFRNIRRDKEHSVISVLGLTAGIVASILIFQYTNFETSYDTFHDQSEGNIYRMARITHELPGGEVTSKNAATFHGFHPAVSQDLPEVLSSTKIFTVNGVFTLNERGHDAEGIFFTTPSFFDVFSFPLLRGKKDDLDQPGTVFLSETLAKRIFQNSDPIGQSIHYNDVNSNIDLEVVVKGIFKDFPANSHLQTPAMLAIPDLNTHANASWFGANITLNEVTWRWIPFHTYIKARKDVTFSQLTGKLNKFIKRYRAPFDESQGREQTVIAQSLDGIHFVKDFTGQLSPSGDKRIILLFKLVGLLIVIIAWINFVNLSSAKAVLKAREVGVRKALGALKKQLIEQFLIETLIINALALFLAIGIVLLVVPAFHQLVGIPVFEHFMDALPFWIGYLLIFILGSIISGVYPALVLTRFQPIKVLRGNFNHSGHGIWMRKSLMLFQFGIVLVLFSGILAIRSQIQYLLNYDIGMNIEQTLVIDSPPPFLRDSLYTQKIESYRDVVQNMASVKETSISSSVPGVRNVFGQTTSRSDRPSNESVFLYRSFIDPFFVSFFDINLLAGRDFDDALVGDGNVVLINEQAVAEFGFESPEDALGKRLVYPAGQTPLIVGVVEDFKQMGMKVAVDPLAMELDTARNSAFMNIRVNTENISETVSKIENEYYQMFPQAPFNAFFLDQTFNNLFETDRKFSAVLQSFAIIAIFISCLGIFGLSSFLINQKMKEVGIRKVLGASIMEIIRVLTTEYIWLIAISTLAAVPVAYLLINNWLNSFLVRVKLEPTFFILPVLGLLLVILVTIGNKTRKAALTNPSKTLKNE